MALVAGHTVDETISGSIEAGRFTYYSLSKPGRVVITLTPTQGDPDIYVGENGTEPDYSLDKHTYQSTTCGVDQVVIPSYALRPIGIGVYGHPSHENSVYELHVRVDEEAVDEGYLTDEYLETPSPPKASESPRSGEGDLEDWEDLPFYNILISLLKLFWEVLLTL